MNLPNKLSMTRIALVPVFMLFVIPLPEWMPFAVQINGALASFGNIAAIIIFIIASLTDSLDGYIARKYNLITNFGKFLDPIADKLLVTAALIALVENNRISGWAALIIISREFIVSGLRIVAASQGVVIAAGKWGKIKTIMQIVAIIAMLLNNYPFSLFTNIPVDRYIMIIAVIITLYSGYEYIRDNIKVLKNA